MIQSKYQNPFIRIKCITPKPKNIQDPFCGEVETFIFQSTSTELHNVIFSHMSSFWRFTAMF